MGSTMIVVSLLGGLGNQLFQWAYGQALISRGYEVNFNRNSLVEYTHREYSLGEYFDLPNCPVIDNFMTEKCMKFDPAFLAPPENTTVVGYFQTEKYFENLATQIRYGFNFHWMKKRLTGVAAEISKEIYQSNSVFLHVRRQDYVGLQHFHGMPTIEYYYEALKEIQSKHHDTKAFLFTDDYWWCAERFPDNVRIVTGTSKYDDLRLMASCKHAILANSSFSWWSCWLGDNQLGRTVISPKRWFSADVENEIAPERWMKL
jgi:hypothetical protein